MTEYYTDRIWGTFELDDATGLPVLPEGEFWRVKKGVTASIHFRIEHRRKSRIGSRIVEWHPIEKKDATTKRLREAAAFTLWKEKKEKASPASDYRKVFGDYPPKKLGA